MPSTEVKHRKGKSAVTPNGQTTTDTTKQCCRDEVKKQAVNQSEQNNLAGKSCVRASLTFDLKTMVNLLSFGACFVLTWVVLQQNARFIEVEEKYRYLHEKAANILILEEKFSAVSQKLDASEDHLKGLISSFTLLTRLEHDVASLNNVVTAIQEDQHTSSHQLQSANERFLNVTETWRSNLASMTDGLAVLRSDSRSVHGRVTDSVNEAESRLHSLAERLEELEAGTRRNARVLERTEEDDARRVQEQLDWTTAQVLRLREQLAVLSRQDAELEEKLDETAPRAQECAAHLPAVEEAVRSILRLGADLSTIQERVEELTLQVLGTEDSMLKTLSQILELRQALVNLQVEEKDLEKNDIADLQCEKAQVVLGNQEVHASLSQLSSLEQEVARLGEWASSVAEGRQRQQENLAGLTRALERIENRTADISSDVAAKVASVRTDVRRMTGLEGEVGGLLAQVGALEEKLAQAERLMVKRMGELLASSIDRISSLKSSTEKNAQNLEQMRRRVPEFAATDKKIFDRILSLESSRAKLVRTVTFASDLRPKVLTVKRDFAMLEPQLNDLTLRIGQLAEDVMNREEDIAQMKEAIAEFVALRGDFKQVEEELTMTPTSSDELHQNEPSKPLTQKD